MVDDVGLDVAGGKREGVKGMDLGYFLEDWLMGLLWRTKEI